MKITKRSALHISLLFALVIMFQPTSAQVVEADQTTAVPVAVNLGAGSTVVGVRISVLRGWAATSIFGVYVTINDGALGTCQLLLADTDVFGFDKSQAVLFVPFGDTMLCNGNQNPVGSGTVEVCATVQQLRDGVFTDFSGTVCNDLTPQAQ